MPFHAGPDFGTTRPYMELAEKIGVLQATLAAAPIRRVEIEVRGETVERLVRPIAAALLKGLLLHALADPVNYINAPVIAEENGISVTQSKGVTSADYPNLISSRIHWDQGSLVTSGTLFGGTRPRIVQLEDYPMDANPQGLVLILRNRDVPGIISQVATILAAHQINIGEWRMGRHYPGGEAMSFINLDNEPPESVLQALNLIPGLTHVRLVSLG
jgi:D-3-phosphoglycerate dehydrogenase